jgi:hypothetical protein
MRTKNRDKDATLIDMPLLDQLTAVNQGSAALAAGQDNMFRAAELWWALKCARARKLKFVRKWRPCGLAKQFQETGWTSLLQQAPPPSADVWSREFYKYAVPPLKAIMDAATTAIDTGNADGLRQLADVLEATGKRTCADPVAHEILHLSGKDDTVADVQKRVATWHGVNVDIKTVRRRMRHLGKKPAPGTPGRPRKAKP